MELLVGLIFWGLIVVGILLTVLGLMKKSSKTLIMSGITLLPSLYFVGANNSLRLLGLVSLIPFVLAYFTKKKKY